MSFADLLKQNVSNKKLPEIKNSVALIIKPKVTQNGDKTKKDLNKVNPESLKLSNVITKNNGSVVIEVENRTEREKAKYVIKEKLGEEYEITFPTSLYLNILITGISFEYDDKQLLELIKKQNQ